MQQQFVIKVKKAVGGPTVQVFQKRTRGTKIARSIPIPAAELTATFLDEAMGRKKA